MRRPASPCDLGLWYKSLLAPREGSPLPRPRKIADGTILRSYCYVLKASPNTSSIATGDYVTLPRSTGGRRVCAVTPGDPVAKRILRDPTAYGVGRQASPWAASIRTTRSVPQYPEAFEARAGSVATSPREACQGIIDLGRPIQRAGSNK